MLSRLSSPSSQCSAICALLFSILLISSLLCFPGRNPHLRSTEMGSRYDVRNDQPRSDKSARAKGRQSDSGETSDLIFLRDAVNHRFEIGEELPLSPSRRLDGSEDDSNVRVENKAKIAYLVLSNGLDAGKLQFLFSEIYHPDNIYLIHVDKKAPTDQARHEKIRALVNAHFGEREGHPLNGRMLEPTMTVTWGGFSLTLACLYGIAAALQWSNDWDYFINLSSSDFPVMTQEDMSKVLGHFISRQTSFMEGSLMQGFETRLKARLRRAPCGMVDDQGLFRAPGEETLGAMDLLSMQRPEPQRFKVYKGEFWMVLHRSFCRYVTSSPDNVARSLIAYFSGMRVSDESYFQTIACHPEAQDFPIHGDCLRHTAWNEDHWENGRRVDKNGQLLLHPQDITIENMHQIQESGPLFARKFGLVHSRRAYAVLHKALQDEAAGPQRVRITLRRLEEAGAFSLRGRDSFCNRTVESVESTTPHTADPSPVADQVTFNTRSKYPRPHRRPGDPPIP
ncbi:unnamed protein product [Choristocarpus tenellus]